MDTATWIQLIIRNLSVADPTVQALLSLRVPYFAMLNQAYGCTWQLAYLQTLRDSVLLLMGSVRSQIDTTTRERRSSARGFTESRMDSQRSAQSDSEAIRFSNALGANRYKDATDASSRSNSTHTRVSGSFSDSLNRYDDRGAGSSRRTGLIKIESISKRSSKNDYTRKALGDTLVKFRYGEDGDNTMNTTGASLVLFGTESRNYTGSTTGTAPSKDNFRTSNDKSEGIGDGDTSGTVRAQRTNVDISTSQFRSNVISHSESISGAQMNDNAGSTAHSEAFGSGAGDSRDAARQDNASRAQAKAESQMDSDAHKGSESEAFLDSQAIKFNQRFLHLSDLYEDVTRQIATLKTRVASSNTGYAVGHLRAVVPNECWCLDASSCKWSGVTQCQ